MILYWTRYCSLFFLVSALAACDDEGEAKDASFADARPRDGGVGDGATVSFAGCLPECIRNVIETCVPQGECVIEQTRRFANRCYANKVQASEEALTLLTTDQIVGVASVRSLCYSVAWTKEPGETGEWAITYSRPGQLIARAQRDRAGLIKGTCGGDYTGEPFTIDLRSPLCKNVGKQGIGFADITTQCVDGGVGSCPDI